MAQEKQGKRLQSKKEAQEKDTQDRMRKKEEEEEKLLKRTTSNILNYFTKTPTSKSSASGTVKAHFDDPQQQMTQSLTSKEDMMVGENAPKTTCESADDDSPMDVIMYNGTTDLKWLDEMDVKLKPRIHIAPIQWGVLKSPENRRKKSKHCQKLHSDKTNDVSLKPQPKRLSVVTKKKFLQFHENYRPAFYGRLVNASQVYPALRQCQYGRRPLQCIASRLVNYDHDSEAEWEEGDDSGESLSDQDNEDEEDGEGELDYEDQWLAYENEIEYVEDDKNHDRNNNDVCVNEEQKVKLKPSSSSSVSTSRRLEPQIIGPYYAHSSVSSCPFELQEYRIEIFACVKYSSPLDLINEEKAKKKMAAAATAALKTKKRIEKAKIVASEALTKPVTGATITVEAENAPTTMTNPALIHVPPGEAAAVANRATNLLQPITHLFKQIPPSTSSQRSVSPTSALASSTNTAPRNQ